MNEKNKFRIDELPPEHQLRQFPLKAPDGYFDTLPSRVQASVIRKSKPAFQISWPWQRTAVTLAGASLIAVLVWQTLPQRQESLGSEALAGVSNDVITTYLAEQGIDPEELADSQEIHASLGADTTAIEFLNVQPTDIRRHIDEHNATGGKTFDS